MYIGAGIAGQIQVLDWIPGIPPVKIDIPKPQKHEIPKDLKLRYTPFGVYAEGKASILKIIKFGWMEGNPQGVSSEHKCREGNCCREKEFKPVPAGNQTGFAGFTGLHATM